MIRLEPLAGERIKRFMAARGLSGPVRVQLRSAGCCDPALSLVFDDVRPGDLTQEIGGLMFIMEPDVYRLTGEVGLNLADDPTGAGFVLTPANPLTEWDGFAVTKLEDR
ncbi:MAG: hypothetical protein AB1641_02045 [Thermodesulfobacteriota bacterium]